MKDCRIQTVYSSPVTRAVQTAEILASVLGACVTVLPGLSEIGVGEWAGKFWKDLADEPVKQNYYIKPHEARPPGGETLAEVQARAVAAIEEACRNGTCEPFLFVSHADVIRSVLAHYLRLDFIGLRQARIDHGSLTALRLVEGGRRVALSELYSLNRRPESVRSQAVLCSAPGLLTRLPSVSVPAAIRRHHVGERLPFLRRQNFLHLEAQAEDL
ncbi:MAG: hypothetical protein KatS3mg082_1601 [Nitrospiraceae bacterium]|nr:MAG: hypothetical protein KatS3mg082_1601 [Nitrospiraceae bacterium]